MASRKDPASLGESANDGTASNPPDETQAAAETIQSCWRTKRKRDIARETALSAAKELTTKREAGVLPLKVTETIQQIKQSHDNGSTITSMLIVRTPVQSYVGHLMQIITIGKYKDAIATSPYDQMFHLSLLLNNKYVLQKNEVIDLSEVGTISDDNDESETREVNLVMDTTDEDSSSSSLTFSSLLENTKRHMGDAKFTNYCAVTNNCQDFVLAVLRGNKLATPELELFIKQDAEGIFNQLPIHTKQVAKALTDSAAVADKVVEDITIKHRETDYSSILKSHVSEDTLEDATAIMDSLKVTKSEAEAILKSDMRKRDKASESFGLLKGKLKRRQEKNHS